MAPTRRSFVKTSGLAALLGVTSLSGCVSDVQEAVGGGPPGYAKWLYDPEEVLDVDYTVFGTLNVQSVYENEDVFPDEMFDQFDDVNDELDAVDLEELEELVFLGYGEPKQGIGGGSAVVSGSFDADEIEESIEERAAEMTGASYQQDGSTTTEPEKPYDTSEYDDYALYTVEQEPSYEGQKPQSLTLAVSDENVVLGYMQTEDATSDDAVETMIDAGGSGGVDRLYSENEDAKAIVDEIGDTTLAYGTTFDADLTNLANESTPDEFTDVVDDLVAVGVSSHIKNEETLESKYVLVYDNKDDVDKDAVQDGIDELQDRAERADEFEDVTVKQKGRVVVVTTTADAEDLFELPSSGSSGASYTATARETEEHPPRTALSFDQTSNDVEMTHRGGDTLQAHEVYVRVGGRVVGYLPRDMRAGDTFYIGPNSITTSDGAGTVDPNTEIQVIWRSSRSGNSAVISQFETN